MTEIQNNYTGVILTHEVRIDGNGYVVTPSRISGLTASSFEEMTQMRQSIEGEVIAGMHNYYHSGYRAVMHVFLPAYPIRDYWPIRTS